MSVSVCTILDTNAPASWSVGRTALWGILLDGVRYLERRYQYNKWWFGTAHSENVPGQDWTDHHSSETKEVKCGRRTLSFLTRYMNYIGTLVKTIPWEHAEQIVENTMCKPHGNPFEFMVLHSRERTDRPKGYASGR